MDRWVTPPKWVTSPTWGPSPPFKQALKFTFEFFDVTLHFRLTYSWLPLGIYWFLKLK